MEDSPSVRWSEFNFVLNFSRVNVWRKPSQEYDLFYLMPQVKQEEGSVKSCTAISWYFAGSIIYMSDNFAATDYVLIFGGQIHPIVKVSWR